MNPVTSLVNDYAGGLLKLSEAELRAETIRALVAAALPDALSVGSDAKVRACNSECRRRGQLYIYDEAYVESIYGAEVAARIHMMRTPSAA